MLAPANHDSMAWFTEGFTEYYANHLPGRSGSVEPTLMRAKVKNVLTGYLYFCESPLFRDVTVATAGEKKGSYRFGMCNGGWAVALSLDVLLRSESDGRRSLDDVLHLLFERTVRSGRAITTDDLRAPAGEVAGRDLSEIFGAL
jgi:predicted metalloprotease with PDZ domain